MLRHAHNQIRVHAEQYHKQLQIQLSEGQEEFQNEDHAYIR